MHKLWILLIYLTASIGRASESDWLLLTLTDDENDLAESACIFIYTKAQAPGSKNKLELSCSFFDQESFIQQNIEGLQVDGKVCKGPELYKQNGFADYKLTETLTDKALLLLSIDDLLRILQKEEQKILTYKASLIHRHISRASEEKIRYTTLTKELERKSTTCPNPFTVALIKELVEIRRSQEQKIEMPFTPLLNALIAHNLYPTVVK